MDGLTKKREAGISFLLAGFLLLSACAAPAAGTPEPTSVPMPEVTATPAPEPTPSPTTTPEAEPTPEEITELWGFPIDGSHDAFEVPTGGRLGTVLVTVEIMEGEESFSAEHHFSVWASDDLVNPLQTMTAEDVRCFKWNDIRDANFDGYMDFGYMYSMGNQPSYWHYWIWDEERGLFVAEPEFDKISWPQFDKETGVISGWARSSALGTGVNTFHQWIEGKLVCIRRIESFAPAFEDKVILSVEDRINGKLEEIFREEYTINVDDPADWLSIQSKWEDLNYHGE